MIQAEVRPSTRPSTRTLPPIPEALVAELVAEHAPDSCESLLRSLGVRITLFDESCCPDPFAGFDPERGLLVFRVRPGDERWEEMMRFGVAAYIARTLGLQGDLSLPPQIVAWRHVLGRLVEQTIAASRGVRAEVV